MSAQFRIAKTPLLAAFFCGAVLLGGCRSSAELAELPAEVCDTPPTPIASVQGDGERTPVAGQSVTVRGIATWIEPGQGVFIEELASDADPATSNALYLDSNHLATALVQGERIVVSGTVVELGDGPDTLTALTSISGMRVCERGVPLPLSEIRLPLDPGEREALEAMTVSFRQALAVTDVYRLNDGRIRLSASRILPAPTEVARPGSDARDQARRNRAASIHARLDTDDRQDYSVGATVMAAEGLLGNDGRYQQLWLREPLPYTPVVQYRNPPPEAGVTRIVSFNLHNYFNGDGRGSGFPTPRGAKTADEFERQRERTRAALRFLDPHLVAVMELENDGFGPGSAADDLLGDLRQATGMEWAVVDALGGPVGTDAITVGLFYRTDRLQPIGPGRVLASQPFQYHNRQPLAQAFLEADSGKSFLVTVNHLKSKGSCPDDGPDADQRDGQGCWNPTRTEAAEGMATWVRRLADDLADGRALIVGDMNAYRMEDPIQAIIESGYKDLTASTGLRLEYSYVFAGQAGTLDYAFASEELKPLVRSARILNINAGFPRGRELEFPWLGSSDHDPVVVDLQLTPPRAIR
jgi:predicted extracellular nuclease